MPLTGLAAAGLSALGGIMTNGMSASYNSEEAQRNRDFQEKMYQRQYRDSIDFWKMQQDFNSPINQLHRLTKAGLNPLLAYGDSGLSGNIAGSAPQTPSAPSGSTAHANFVNPFETAQYLLIDAEREKKQAETNKIKSETDWQTLENQWQKESYDVRLAIQSGNLDYVRTSVEKLRTDMMNSTRLTTQQCLSMIQGRMYEVKRFNLDADTYGAKIQQGWKGLELQSEQNKIQWSQTAALWQRIKNETNMTYWQTGRIAFDIAWDSKFNPLRMKGLSLDNVLKRWDSHLKKATLSEKQSDIVRKNLENFYYGRYGTTTPFEFKSFYDLQNLRSFSNMLDMMFFVPFSN